MFLKRARESSPPPSSSPEYHLPFDLPDPKAKRQRLAGPSAWEARIPHQYDPHYFDAEDDDEPEDDDEDEDADEEEPEIVGDHSQSPRSPSQYNSINALLQSLHSEHARIPPSVSNSHPNQASSSHSSLSKLPPPSSPHPQHPHGGDSGVQEAPRAGKLEVKAEMESVRMRYEDINKLLGSLVLGRRRTFAPEPLLQPDPNQ